MKESMEIAQNHVHTTRLLLVNVVFYFSSFSFQHNTACKTIFNSTKTNWELIRRTIFVFDQKQKTKTTTPREKLTIIGKGKAQTDKNNEIQRHDFHGQIAVERR